ncbi:MarR family transcriptional regulator [Streptomyces zaomyceticus]|uniref:MarR family transcriptional regulator n=1 Tax=Streptomyces zaomyceticus TaxID=68286 RepID=UPI00369A83ED
MTMPAFDPERDLAAPPLYSLNLSAGQRSVLAWIEEHGGLFSAIEVPVETVAKDCGSSGSTVYDALSRLLLLGLLLRDEVTGYYRINARYFFAMNPDVRRLLAAALSDPPVTPDARAQAPRKVSNADARRRRVVKPVPTAP